MSNPNSPDVAGRAPSTTTESSHAGSGPESGDKLSTLAADAGEATKHVAGTAKEEAGSVASEAGNQAKKLIGQVGDELKAQAANQQTRAADALHATGSSFSKMADSSDDRGYAPQLVRAAGDRIDSVASWLGTKEPGEVLEDVKRFARRRPGVFIAVAVGVGLIVGRVVRSLASPATDDARGPAQTAAGSATPTDSFAAPAVPPVRETVTPGATPVRVSTGASTGTRAVGADSDFPSEFGDPR